MSTSSQITTAMLWLELGRKVARRAWAGQYLTATVDPAGKRRIWVHRHGSQFYWRPDQEDAWAHDWEVVG